MSGVWIATKKLKSGETGYSVRWMEGTKNRSKSTGRGTEGKLLARQLRDRLRAQMLLSQFTPIEVCSWKKFVDRYTNEVLAFRALETAETNLLILANFQKITGVSNVTEVDANTLDDFVHARRQQPGRVPGTTVAASTINKELSVISRALVKAFRWKYLYQMPPVEFLPEPERWTTYVSHEEFERLYKHCGAARHPDLPGIHRDAWWKAFLLYQIMTGWRVGQVLAIEMHDWNRDANTIMNRHPNNKVRRDERISVHAVVYSHLQPLDVPRHFANRCRKKLFPWNMDRRCLYRDFECIQQAAQIEPRDKPEGRWYSFHDLRRGFATMNADRMDPFELQQLMQHRDLKTTMKYVQMAQRIKMTADKVKVPNLA